MKIDLNHRSYTLTELLISSVLVIILFGTALGTYVLTKHIYVDCIASANLQRDIAIVARKITQGIDGGVDNSGHPYLCGLTSAKSYTIVSPTHVDFRGSDGNMRTIQIGNPPDQNKIIFMKANETYANALQHPLYTAPASSTLSLLFWPARFFDGTTTPGVTIPGPESIAFYISVLQQVIGHNASASLRTTVNLRGLP